MRRWREQGGGRALACPACGDIHPLEALSYQPPAAFARQALVFSDVASSRLEAPTRQALESCLGPVRVVLRRML